MSFDIGQILVLILFILLPLLNFVMRRITRYPESRTPEDESRAQVRRQERPTPRPRPEPRVPRDPSHEIQPPTVSISVSRRRFARRAIFQTRRDARRGIILMTLLGPCRAYDPPG